MIWAFLAGLLVAISAWFGFDQRARRKRADASDDLARAADAERKRVYDDATLQADAVDRDPGAALPGVLAADTASAARAQAALDAARSSAAAHNAGGKYGAGGR